MIPVANSSVLISLSAINQLALLPHRFPQGVLIPEAVWREVVLTGRGRPGAQAVAQATWLQVQPVQNRTLIALLRSELDEGEAEAIALAQERRIPMVLLDEKQARQTAQRLSLATLGTVGVLLWATQAGLLPSLQMQLDQLQTKGNFRIHWRIYEAALKAAGERE